MTFFIILNDNIRSTSKYLNKNREFNDLKKILTRIITSIPYYVVLIIENFKILKRLFF